MDVKKLGKNFASKIEQNLRPLSTHLPFPRSKVSQEQSTPADFPSSLKKVDIEDAYKTIKQNAIMEDKTNIKIITCLKNAHKSWQQYINSPNKNGQLASIYQAKLKRVQKKFQQELSTLLVQGDMQKIRKVSELLKPMIEHLQKKSRKYKQHETQFKIISKKNDEIQKESEQKDEEIKDEMIELVEKFKKYAMNINENLVTDNGVIKKIGESQDKHLVSLQSKNTSMEQIIKEQKLGFFQLIGMGIFAIVLWVIGLMLIIII